ncbi:methylamine utilization protein [Methylophaga sp. OBS3]|uniref:methylamine utilization protein n=1 Tax=Methylophaga sp. OBS3 TaxID=2991934 RepID=UPI00225B93CE|nr:methylamine utilization protein [Methylophaga sp. OBS3]MCX4188889.1 methylamine utilization protein [Methylophaga sp. OBS3]
MRISHYFVSLVLALSHAYAFADVTIMVQDQQGNPLSDAVIEVISDTPQVGSNKSIAIMDQIDKTFVPELLIVNQGQLVDFPNSDNIRHHVYSFSSAKQFELKLYADRPENPVAFEQAGVVVLGCNIHDSMVGYIYVAKDRRIVKTNETGIASLPVISEDTQFTVWHADQSLTLEKRATFSTNTLTTLPGTDHYLVTIETSPPAPRDTFEDTFRATFD